jgi:radical SAM superfamily enzyme YgiQ (UPF0313 family)
MYLAAYLQRELGADVRILDALFELDAVRSVREAVRSHRPHAVGISSLTTEAVMAHRIARSLKEEWPDLPVILGGPHASSDPELAAGESGADAVVIGEGEITLAEIVRRIVAEGPRWRDPRALREIRGIAFRDGDRVERTASRPLIADLDALPFPSWDLVDYRRFWRLQGMATSGIRPYMSMLTSRGCPYGCIFCHQFFGRRFRARSPESVAAEVVEIRKRGMGDIEILDDIANFDRDRFDRMLTGLLDRDLHPVLSFPNAIRADLIEDKSLDLLKRVGAGEVTVAVETASERLQRMLKKNLSLDRVRHTIDAMAERRIFSRGFFMLGFPTETAEEMRKTIRFAHSSHLHLALFFIPTPFRNTALYRMFLDAGKIPDGVRFIDFEYFGSQFIGSDVPGPLFRALYRWAYWGFYLDPGRAYRIARDRPSLSDIPSRVYSLFWKDASFRRMEEA